MPQLESSAIADKIAIIGMGCRFPGDIKSPQDFWHVLINGIDCITEVPQSRWNLDAFYSAYGDKPGKLITRKGGYIQGADEFDPAFFGITPREADYMDPQQRKLLEVTWEALEDGGQKPSELAGKPVGVFIGAFTNDYKILQFGGSRHDNLAAHTSTGVMMTMVSNRISYIYDFRGPSISIDTACSSSLVAVNLACESIRNGESKLAIAGGTLLQFAPQYTIAESKGGFLSPSGWSHAFDSSANGYVRAEGVGVVVLKKLDDAIRDGDPVYAVIIGSGVNQDGHTNGITVPNGDAQVSLIKQVCKKAGIQPGDLQYVEAHGTGTPVGDPIEANSLGRVLCNGRKPGSKCFIGSVKTNIGHAESAAGVAGLMKTVLSINNKKIPPHLHLREINPKIEIDKWPYQIPREVEDWPEHDGPARAGVNSFGFGGTNSHVLLEEAHVTAAGEKKEVIPRVERPAIFPLTARAQGVFASMADKYVDMLYGENIPSESSTLIEDVGYTLGIKREHHDQRLALIYTSKEELLNKLEALAKDEDDPLVIKGKRLPLEKQKLVWIFTGMGPQWWAMGRELYEKEPVYREMIDRCDREMSKWFDWSLVNELNASEQDSNMAETWLSQPANFALQLALAALWRSWGIEPDAIIGHSTGEAAAFYEAGVYSLEDAVKVIIHRSSLQQTVSGTGKMVAVGLPVEEVEPLLQPYGDKISIAAVNSPHSLTIAGNEEALNEFIKPLQEEGIFCRYLQVKIPFHSAYMNPIKERLLDALKDIKPQTAKVALYSTAMGTKVEGTELDADYWWQNVRGSVLFTRGLNSILDDGYAHFLEVGPHPVLAGSITECLEDRKISGRILCSLRRKENEQQRMVTTLSELFTMGFNVNWNEFYPNGKYTRLPAYPWKKERYWAEPGEVQLRRFDRQDHPLLGRRMLFSEPVWESGLSTEKMPYLKDHRIQDNIVFPAAGYVEMAFSAINSLVGSGNIILEDLELKKALFLSDNQEQRVQFLYDSDRSTFKIVTYDSESNSSVAHALGKLRLMQNVKIAESIDINQLIKKFTTYMSQKECYEKLDALGYNYEHCFQGIRETWVGTNEILARIEIPDAVRGNVEDYFCHPSIMDSCFQTLIAGEFGSEERDKNLSIRLPVSIGKIRVTKGVSTIYVHSRSKTGSDDSLIGDITMYDEKGNAVGEITGFIAVSVDKATGAVAVSTMDKWLYEVEWQEKHPTEPTNKNMAENNNSSWLIFADQLGYADELATVLRQRGYHSLLVYQSDEYSIEGSMAKAYVNPVSKEDIGKVINNVLNSGQSLEGILHMWNIDMPGLEELTAAEMNMAKKVGCYSILNTVKVINENNIQSKLWIVTRGAQEVGTEEELNVLASAVWGMGRVLGQTELADRWGGLIDLDSSQTVSVSESVSTLYDQITSRDGEDLIAFRNGKCYVQRLVQANNISKPVPTQFRSDACYIITGAFGALGQLTAMMMAKQGAKRLVLMGRIRIPSRSEWGYIEKDSETYKRIEFIKNLEAMGVEVITVSVDINDEAQVREFFSEFARKNYPAIRGVVHAAGVVKDIPAADMGYKEFDMVYDTKVMGSFLLHKYLRNQPVEYFVLYSSIASLVTTNGQVNYAAGNAFLDMLAKYRRRNGLPALSINWGPWATGMIKDLNLIDYYKNSRGMNSILPEVGMSVLHRITGQDVAQIVVCEADWPVVLSWYPKKPVLFAHLAASEESGGTSGQESFESLFMKADQAGRYEVVREHLAEMISKVLRTKRSELDLDASLNAMGIDSILATELRNKISAQFGHMFTAVKLLSGATISNLAEELVISLNERIGEQFAEAALTEIDDSVSVVSNVVNVVNVLAKQSDNIHLVDEYPLSYGQKAIWFINQMTPESPAYNIGGAMHIPTKVNVPALRKAIQGIIDRHPALRTNFFIKEGEPYQRVHATRNENMIVVDVEGKQWNEILPMVVVNFRKPFDLENDSLIRIYLYKQSEESYYFTVTIYHIISDAWSNYMFIDEMLKLYDKNANGKDVMLPAPTADYKEFVEWENRLVNSLKGSRMFQYWRNNLPQEIPALNLPTDKPRPAVQTNNGASYNFVINKDITRGVKELSKDTGATVFMVLFSSFYTLLHKYSGQEDIIVGCPVAGRTDPKFARVYGYFVNPLPLWANFKGNPTFVELLKQVQNKVLKGLENQEYPFALLVERLNLEHDPSRSAVFQTLFVYLVHRVEQTHADVSDVNGVEYNLPMKLLEVPEEEGQFELTMSIYEEDGEFHAAYKYNSDLFVESTMVRMAEHFKALLSDIISSPEKQVSELSMLTSGETENILYNWSGAGNLIDTVPECVHSIFESVAQEKANNIAVSVPDEDGLKEQLTYVELNARANKLARFLRTNGVGVNLPVGICMEKSCDMVVSVLAVLKAGGAYIPLDTSYPVERIEYILDNSNSGLLITHTSIAEKLGLNTAKVICVDELAAEIDKEDAGNIDNINSQQDIAYLVYTSGSTGNPKGVKISHINYLSIYGAWEKEYHLKEDTTSHLQVASFSFDVFCGDLARALLSGGKLVLCRREILLNIPLLYKVMHDEQVDCGEFVPAVATNLITYLLTNKKNLDFMRLVIVGSDVWTIDEYRKLKSLCGENTRVINSYGLSETTIDSTYFEEDKEICVEDGPVPIGKPFPNTEVYILDQYHKPVPTGVPGEIYIAGDGVAQGYVNNPKAGERFVALSIEGEIKRLYKTGDMAKWDPSGNINILQRIDNQVKIRGYRIELEEIEKHITAYPGVARAVVAARESANGQKMLCAYYTTIDGVSVVEHSAVSDTLADRLPGYMIPQVIMKLNEFPLTPNGKIDVKALPITNIAVNDGDIIAPGDIYEKKIADIWTMLLGLNDVSIKDDFFKLGGTSLNLIELMMHIQKEYNIKLSVKQLLNYTTLEGMARTVANVVTGKEKGAEPYIEFNPSSKKVVYCFPPAGGYSIVYKSLAETMKDVSLLSFNYIQESDKINRYADIIQQHNASGPYTLFGYSLGGNLAFEVARELENRGAKVAGVIVMDSYRIDDTFNPSEEDLKKFEIELAEHFRKHTGSEIVQKHTLEQAKKYISFCYETKNLGRLEAPVHFIIEDNPEDMYRDKRTTSWNGSSLSVDKVYQGIGKHAEMLDQGIVVENSLIIKNILFEQMVWEKL